MPYVEQQLGSGLNLKAAATDIRDDQLQQAKGCRYDTEGAVSSENGRKTLNSATGEVRGVGDATLGGTKVHINKRGTTLHKDGTSIGAFGAGTGHISVVAYNDYAYIADGTTFKRYQSGTTLGDVGVDAPDIDNGKPTLAASGSGSGMEAGTYRYVYTFFNGVAESNFSPEESVTITAGQQVDISDLDVSTNSAVTARRIYRTDKDGSAFFFLQEVANNTATTATDTAKLPNEAADTASPGDAITEQETAVDTLPFDQESYRRIFGAGALKTLQDKANRRGDSQVVQVNLGYFADWTDHDKPPAAMSHLVFINEQIFGISGNKIHFSRVVEPEHWPILNQFPVGRQTGDTIRSIMELDGRLVIYTDSGVYVYSQIGLTFEDGRLEQSNSPVGLAGEWAVTDVSLPQGGTGHLFLAKNGIYIFDGLNAIEMSFAIEPLFTDSSHADYITPSTMNQAVMASSRDKAWMSYASGSSANNRTLLADFQDASNPKIAIMPYGFTTLRRDSVTNAIIGGDASGNLYEVDLGGSDGGSALTWEPITKDFTFGEPTKLKNFKDVVIDADFGGVSTTVTVTTNLGRTSSFTDSSSGRKRIHRYLPTTMKGHSANIKISSSGTSTRQLFAVGLGVDGMDVP